MRITLVGALLIISAIAVFIYIVKLNTAASRPNSIPNSTTPKFPPPSDGRASNS
jgi:hypothetical protein